MAKGLTLATRLRRSEPMKGILCPLRFAAVVIIFFFDAQAQVRLTVNDSGVSVPVVRLDEGVLYARRIDGSEFSVSPDRIQLEGDLVAERRQVLWAPEYAIIRSPLHKWSGSAPLYEATVSLAHTPASKAPEKPLNSELLDAWPEGSSGEMLVVVAWVVDRKLDQIRIVPITPGKLRGFFFFRERLELSELARRGQPVLLGWREGAFLEVRNRVQDEKVAEAFIAARVDDEESLVRLLAAGLAPRTAVTRDRRTLLHAASEAGSLRVVERLLATSADPSATDFPDQLTPLHLAARNGREDVVKRLVVSKKVVNERTVAGVSAIMTASRNGHLESVQHLLDARADVRNQSRQEESVHGGSITAGYSDVAELVHRRGTDSSGLRLSFAYTDMEYRLVNHAIEGHSSMVGYLLKKKVSPNSSTRTRTALQAAAISGDPATIKLLVDAGARVDEQPPDTPSALMLSVTQGSLDAVRLLVAAGAEINRKDRAGATALHAAAGANRIEIVEFLLREGADPSVRTEAGISPLGVALLSDAKDVAAQLIALGQRIDWREQPGPQLLESVLRLDQVELLRTMLADGLAPNAELIPGWPLLSVARALSASRSEEELLSYGAAFSSDEPLIPLAQTSRSPFLRTSTIPLDPRLASEDFDEDTLWVEVVISADGRVLWPRVAAGNTHRLFPVARRLVASWRFEPALHEGHPVATQLKVPVFFPSSRSRVFLANQVARAPRMFDRPKPKYPTDLIDEKISGEVKLSVVVGMDGIPESIQLDQASHPAFAPAAVAAVEKWVFEPGVRNGTPVRTLISFSLTFAPPTASDQVGDSIP